MDSAVGDFDTKEFIKEVKKYPCIWNYKHEEHGDRQRRMEAWAEISNKFYNYEQSDKPTQEKIELKLIKRWKTLRDSFVRAMAINQVRKYLYYDDLKFLTPLKKPKRKMQRSAESSDDDNQADYSPEQMMIAENIASPYSVHTEEPIPTEPYLQESNRDHLAESFDSDKHFLMSLVNDMKRIPDEFKLDAKSEIIEVIKKYRRAPQYQIEHRISGVVVKNEQK